MKKVLIDISLNTAPMKLFGTEHLIPLLLLVLFVFFLVSLKKRSPHDLSSHRLGHTIAWILFLNYPSYLILQYLEGSLSWGTSLPLYPCTVSSLMAPILLRSKNTTFLNVFFYWVFAGTLQAVITPEIKSTFPVSMSVRYAVENISLFLYWYLNKKKETKHYSKKIPQPHNQTY